MSGRWYQSELLVGVKTDTFCLQCSRLINGRTFYLVIIYLIFTIIRRTIKLYGVNKEAVMFEFSIIGFTINTIWAVILLLIWIGIAFWPARVAARKGHSFLGYFILSLFFFPLALLIAYLSPDRTRSVIT